MSAFLFQDFCTPGSPIPQPGVGFSVGRFLTAAPYWFPDSVSFHSILPMSDLLTALLHLSEVASGISLASAWHSRPYHLRSQTTSSYFTSSPFSGTKPCLHLDWRTGLDMSVFSQLLFTAKAFSWPGKPLPPSLPAGFLSILQSLEQT